MNERRVHPSELDVAFMLALAIVTVGAIVAAYERSLHLLVFAVLLAVIGAAWVTLE